MPVSYSIQQGLLTIECTGIYESSDLVRCFLDAMKDPSRPPHVVLLVDVSTSESLPTRPTEEIRAVAEFLGPYAERIGGRCALVASPDVQFGLGQMGSVYSEGVGIATGVFRSRREAMEWLFAPSTRPE